MSETQSEGTMTPSRKERVSPNGAQTTSDSSAAHEVVVMDKTIKTPPTSKLIEGPPYEIVTYTGQMFKMIYKEFYFLKIDEGKIDAKVIQITGYTPTVTHLPKNELTSIGVTPRFEIVDLKSHEFKINGLQSHEDLLNKWSGRIPKIKQEKKFS